MLRYIRSIPSTASLTWWLRISATLCAIIAKAPVVRYCLSKAFRPFIGPTELGSTNARHEPAIGATFLARLVGLRRSLVRCTTENEVLLSEMHRLGLKVPTHELVRINSILAFKTMLMGTPWNLQEFEAPPHYLSPKGMDNTGERRYFKELAASWNAQIERQIAGRLPK